MPADHNDSDGENTHKEKFKERTSSESEKPKNRDDLFRIELGEFGWFQLRYVLIVAIPVLFSGIRNDYILSSAAIPHRCQIPECGENSKMPIFNPEWISNAVPETNSGFSSCNRYAALDIGINGSLDYCPASLFDQTNIVSCKDFVYAYDNTVVYDFDLGCREWLRALAGTVANMGLLVGLPLTGYISDRLGRKVALVFNIFCLGLVGVIRAFSFNYIMYIILQLAQTAFGASIYSTALVMATELIGPKYRFVGVSLMSMYSLGQVMLGGVYWLIGSWRYATLALCIPCLFMIVDYWLLSESIRWLLVKKKYAEARKIIETLSKVNKRPICDEAMAALLKPHQHPPPRSGAKTAGLIRTLIRSPILLRRVCTTPVWWIAGTFVYYGLSINSVGLSDSMYLNYMLTSAVGIPGCFVGAYLVNKVGRKATMSSGFFSSALCSIVFIVIPSGNASMSTVRLIIYLLGKFAVSIAMSSIYLYTSELYPTEYRQTLLAFSSTVGRLGSIAAPLTPVFVSIMFAVSIAMSSVYLFTSELNPTEYRHTLLAFSSTVGRLGSIAAPLTPVFVCIMFAVSIAMSSVYLFTSELYPTEYRHTLLAFSSTVGRLGSIAAPLTPVYFVCIMFAASIAMSSVYLFTSELYPTEYRHTLLAFSSTVGRLGSIAAPLTPVFVCIMFAVSIAMSSVYLFTSELYPTEYRHTLLAFSSTVGRLGSIAAPLTPVFVQYWDGLPSVMFGAMGLLAGALALTQPETLGAKLPDTFAEAELLGKPDFRLRSEPR